MADAKKDWNQPPQVNKPAGQPGQPAAAPEQKGSAIGKIIKLVLVVVIVGLIGHMGVTSKKVAEQRAQKEGKPLEQAGFVFPWQWTSDEWKAWTVVLNDAANQAGGAISEKAKAAKDAAEAKYKAWKDKKAGTATPVATPPAPGTPPVATPPATPSEPAPAGLGDAKKLVEEGGELMFGPTADPAKAKDKFQKAIALLEPMQKQAPNNPEVTETLNVAKESLVAIDESTPR